MQIALITKIIYKADPDKHLLGESQRAEAWARSATAPDNFKAVLAATKQECLDDLIVQLAAELRSREFDTVKLEDFTMVYAMPVVDSCGRFYMPTGTPSMFHNNTSSHAFAKSV